MITVYSKGTNKLFVFWMAFCTTLFLAPRVLAHLAERCPKTQYYFMNRWRCTIRPKELRKSVKNSIVGSLGASPNAGHFRAAVTLSNGR